MDTINEDCEKCKVSRCPSECFNKHVGSVIALTKWFGKVFVTGDFTAGFGKRDIKENGR